MSRGILLFFLVPVGIALATAGGKGGSQRTANAVSLSAKMLVTLRTGEIGVGFGQESLGVAVGDPFPADEDEGTERHKGGC